MLHHKVVHSYSKAAAGQENAWLVSRITRMVNRFSVDELEEGLSALNTLAIKKANGNIPGYESFVASMAYKNATPYQTMLTLRYLKKEDLIDDVTSFEDVADFSRLELDGITIPWDKTGRRWDAMLDTKMLEMKGAKRWDDQFVDGRFSREFKNDMLHYLFYITPPPDDFEWIIKTTDGADRYKKRIEKMLGVADESGDIIGSLDGGLRQVLEQMEELHPDRYEEALDRLVDIRKKFDEGKLVLTGPALGSLRD